jgi:hypothetical protein
MPYAKLEAAADAIAAAQVRTTPNLSCRRAQAVPVSRH